MTDDIPKCNGRINDGTRKGKLCGGTSFHVEYVLDVDVEYPMAWDASKGVWYTQPPTPGTTYMHYLNDPFFYAIKCDSCGKRTGVSSYEAAKEDATEGVAPGDSIDDVPEVQYARRVDPLCRLGERIHQDAMMGIEEGVSMNETTTRNEEVETDMPTTRAAETDSRNDVVDRGHTATCALCGRPFTGARSDARYCSNACRQAAHRARS